ncbi:NADH(P)-binding domain-containing protein [Pochonia chlamydosporia 170]|uniref:NADH(P)-binding domain-containing protein n=1 Tax=Pochonia chlamydosporia 170 TaxID=1380566 RepID=A0A179FI24_METCM|nr:NADH(P)-binding domain-containing protein [Pochonia chlamydosporia 170]OAQ64930.1 NADH(P)-binding domain-containing protein [Pochonia chlamydosporia 170]
MRVAVAGSGAMARYICDEFPKYGHEVVILSRTSKEEFENRGQISQVVTDYSVPSLTNAILECDVLISMILSYTKEFVDVHLNLIKACQASPRCKRFIPSEYGGDLETYPDLPHFYYLTRDPIRQVLREQKEIEWTLVSVGWLADYIVPKKNRYLTDAGEAFPIDITSKKVIIPGTGNDPVDLTAARDLARALALLVSHPSWEPYTYISGEKTTWNELAMLVQRQYVEMKDVQRIGLGQILHTIQTSDDEMEVLFAHYQIGVPLQGGSLDHKKVEAHRQKFFSGMAFKKPHELIEEARQNPNGIV